MAILRFFLFFAVIYYVIRLLAGWLLFRAREGKKYRGKNGKTPENNYEHLTDQKIEDADFEDLGQGGR